jgi:TonB family protein
MAMAASGGDLKQRVVRLVDQHHCSSNDDSGKFLASILIIFSVCLVAIKPYLNASIIDFTSGRISLFKTANDIIQQKPANAANLSATSIAQLLLQQETNENKPQEITESTIVNTSIPPKEVNKVLEKTISNTRKELKLDNNIAVTTKNQDAISQQKKTKLAPVVVPVIKQVEKKSQTESLLTKPQEKSISELAFERTDSSNKKSTMKNPYSSQVASLINEPIVNNEPQKISKFAFPTDKKAQPRYTITSPKKTQIINKKPIRKSAEILRSPDPKYPSTATRRGIEMDITVNFTIDTDGVVRDITFEQKSKVSYFRSAIRNAMAKWRFLPAQVNGQPIESKMTKIFSFSLAK